MNTVGAAAALVFGVHTLITRRVKFGEDDDEYQVWLYGWRAVAIGLLALMLAAYFIASLLGYGLPAG
ncbi:MAG: hypothetical protein RL375_3734 [Pseudomonadota bacterium]|jgi:O-antigen/teichoic acid export membrane protein